MLSLVTFIMCIKCFYVLFRSTIEAMDYIRLTLKLWQPVCCNEVTCWASSLVLVYTTSSARESWNQILRREPKHFNCSSNFFSLLMIWFGLQSNLAFAKSSESSKQSFVFFLHLDWKVDSQTEPDWTYQYPKVWVGFQQKFLNHARVWVGQM